MMIDVPPKDTLAPNIPLKKIGITHTMISPTATDKYDVVQNPAKIFCGRLTRSNSWNEATLAFHIIGNLNRVKRDRRIKIRKEYDKHNVQHQTK